MTYYNSDSFQVVDQETYQVYGGAFAEDLAAIEAMSGKQYGSFDASAFDPSASLLYMPTPYDSPGTDQNELAALPNISNAEFDQGYLYAHSRGEIGANNGIASTSTSHYSTIPASAPLQLQTGVPYASMPQCRKRKASVESFDSGMHTAKRLHVELTDPSGEYVDVKDEGSPYSSVVPTPTNLNGYHIPLLGASPRAANHQHSTSNTSQISLPATAPYTPTVSPSFTSANTEHSPRAPATPGPRAESTGPNPKLVRTSTISQPSPQAIPASMTLIGHTQNFNPYTMYSPDCKARLHMQGDLDAVGRKWTEKELEARRKIVVFNRSQKGNDIHAEFEVVSQDHWKNHPRSVSCIWWEEKQEAYVTSVDTILLLEGLVAARFTVEEKNRIRRNLEGFKPDTVSKAKSDTEEFFKIIMGFPNPKPRNIEKDVKVFPWKVLSVALQKIISKYSASYASTASSLGAQSKMQRGMEYAEYAYSTSPGPEYHNGMQVAAFPAYEQPGRMSAPATPAPSMHLTPHVPQGYEHQAGYGYPTVQMPPHSHSQYAGHLMTAPVHPAGYWQHPAYTGDHGVPVVPASAPPTAYPREMIPSQDFRHTYGGYH